MKNILLLLVIGLSLTSCLNKKPDSTSALLGSWVYVGVFDGRKDNILEKKEIFNPSKSICKVEFSDRGTYLAKISQEEITGDFDITIKESGKNFIEGEFENFSTENTVSDPNDNNKLKQLIEDVNYFKIEKDPKESISPKLYLSVDEYTYILFAKK